MKERDSNGYDLSDSLTVLGAIVYHTPFNPCLIRISEFPLGILLPTCCLSEFTVSLRTVDGREQA
jgi:hypothetical protein